MLQAGTWPWKVETEAMADIRLPFHEKQKVHFGVFLQTHAHTLDTSAVDEGDPVTICPAKPAALCDTADQALSHPMLSHCQLPPPHPLSVMTLLQKTCTSLQPGLGCYRSSPLHTL